MNSQRRQFAKEHNRADDLIRSFTKLKENEAVFSTVTLGTQIWPNGNELRILHAATSLTLRQNGHVEHGTLEIVD
jgi:hypothetical protein